MLNESNEDYLSSLSSEISAKNNILSKRKNKIHNNIAHFHQISNDIRHRNQVLQSYTLNMIKAKQKLEKDQKSFHDTHNQKNTQLEQEFSTFENKLNSLMKHDIEIKQEIKQKNDQKQHYHQAIEEDEKKIQDIEKIIRFNSKSNRMKLQEEIEQLSILLNETQSHCQQFLQCVNSLDKDFDLLKKSKENIRKKGSKVQQLICLEKSNYDQVKAQILSQTQIERTKQKEHRQNKKEFIQLKQKYELRMNSLSKNQEQTIDSLHFYEKKLKETSKNQAKILNQILALKNREENINNRYLLFINYSNNNDVFLNDMFKDKIKNQLNNLLSEIDKSKTTKNDIYSKINTENKAISQHLKEIDCLEMEAESVILNENVDSINFPHIFEFLKDLQNLEKDSLNEIEKWKSSSITSSNIESMLKRWNNIISF